LGSTFKECSIRSRDTPGMSDGFQANTLTFSLKNQMSASSYLGSRFDPISVVLLVSPSTSWISLYSLDLIDFCGASSSGISS
jgi:hypothetical protein